MQPQTDGVPARQTVRAARAAVRLEHRDPLRLRPAQCVHRVVRLQLVLFRRNARLRCARLRRRETRRSRAPRCRSRLPSPRRRTGRSRARHRRPRETARSRDAGRHRARRSPRDDSQTETVWRRSSACRAWPQSTRKSVASPRAAVRLWYRRDRRGRRAGSRNDHSVAREPRDVGAVREKLRTRGSARCVQEVQGERGILGWDQPVGRCIQLRNNQRSDFNDGVQPLGVPGAMTANFNNSPLSWGLFHCAMHPEAAGPVRPCWPLPSREGPPPHSCASIAPGRR